MKVDNERLKAVVKAIDDLAISDKSYSFDAFCKKNDLYKHGVRERVSDIFIACPFHNDRDPSMAIKEEHRRYNCFGCGASGDYISFLTRYDNDCLGISTSYAQKANELLNNDARIQDMVGFSSVFRKETSVKEIERLEFTKFQIQHYKPTGYLELASRMQKENVTIEQIQYAISLMQHGIAPDVIYVQLKDVECCKRNTKKYTVAELEEE